MQVENSILNTQVSYNESRKKGRKFSFRTFLFKQFTKLQNVHIIVKDSFGHYEFGDKNFESIKISVKDPAFYRKAIMGGTMGVSESYLDGEWECEDLYSLFKVFSSQKSSIKELDGPLTRWTRPYLLFKEWLVKNSLFNTKKNISAHYDLGNDLFENFLDPTMSYSSALFESNNNVHKRNLEEASIAKVDRLCQILELKKNDHLLEIGTGWGYLAIHAAQKYSCRVTSVTLSKNQKKYAEDKIKSLGLENQITILLKDYRELRGQYSKLVSVEMIEAVGPQYIPSYFKQCRELLKKDGLAALQAITIPDHAYKDHLKNVDFIQKYIFPGSKIPAISVLLNEASKNGRFVLEDLKDMSLDYAQTMRSWRKNFKNNINDIRKLGYDERFLRMWDYYLSYCSAGFQTRYLGTVQMLLRKHD